MFFVSENKNINDIFFYIKFIFYDFIINKICIMESLQTYLSSESEDESLDKRSKPNKENSLPTTM